MLPMLFFLTVIVYSLYAFLPFLEATPKVHYVLGILCATIGSMVWVTISRSVDRSQLVLYGAYFDMIITLSFIVVPLIAGGLLISTKQVIGILIMLVGLIIAKF